MFEPKFDPCLCFRSDGSIVLLDGAAMILQSDPSGQNNGLYTCFASFYHHTASVTFQVEVLRESEQLSKCRCSLTHLDKNP